MGMIVANKWLRAAYGTQLRRFLLANSKPVVIVDFGHAPIFPDADTFPCVPILERLTVPANGRSPDGPHGDFLGCYFPREEYEAELALAPKLESRLLRIPVNLLRDEAWSLEDPRVHKLLAKLRASGVALSKYVGQETFFGIKTGFNEAFYIDGDTRARILRGEAGSGRFIHPLIRGRDIRRWHSDDSGVFLIGIPSSENADHAWSEAKSDAECIFSKAQRPH
jgi:hypothetical protein